METTLYRQILYREEYLRFLEATSERNSFAYAASVQPDVGAPRLSHLISASPRRVVCAGRLGATQSPRHTDTNARAHPTRVAQRGVCSAEG